MSDMRSRARAALDNTWQAIGSDLMACAAEDDSFTGCLSREEVIDAVASCGFKGGYPMSFGEDDEAVKWLDAQPREVQDQILQEAFPHTYYG
jgi:hypothetical protein